MHGFPYSAIPRFNPTEPKIILRPMGERCFEAQALYEGKFLHNFSGEQPEVY
jgi:hypothetical protein